MIKVGIIGYKNHARILIELIDSNASCKLEYIYHPTKDLNFSNSTNNIADLYSCDVVIIASPNDTHYEYINLLLSNSKCYIFCEKIPVTKLEDVEKLEKLSDEDKGRLYFNYNFRYSYFNETLQNPNLGKFQHINIIATHGLAFKSEFKNSWRAKNPHAITETVSIHFIDLLTHNLGKIKSFLYYHYPYSNTSLITAVFENGITCSIFASYASPLHNEMTIIGTDGILKMTDDRIIVRSPRDTFDDNGFFKEPPITKNTRINLQEDLAWSLEESLDIFMTHVRVKQPLNYFFDESLYSNRILLEMEKTIK